MIACLLCRARALPQATRFILAGGFAAAANWLIRFPLSVVMPFLPAVIMATAIGMVLGFGLYQNYVFPGSPRPLWLRLRDFVLVNSIASIGVAVVAVLSRSTLLHVMAAVPAQALAHAAGIVAGAVINFVGHRSLTFRADAGPGTRRHAPPPGELESSLSK